MQRPGADVSTLRGVQGFYSQRCKFFKLDGCYTSKFIACNGILQGCPLSMMILTVSVTSLATAWLEKVRTEHPTASPKAYADDLSVCSAQALPQRYADSYKRYVISLTSSSPRPALSSAWIIKTSASARPAFATQCLAYKVASAHFGYIVGGAIKLAGRVQRTPLEKERCDSYRAHCAPAASRLVHQGQDFATLYFPCYPLLTKAKTTKPHYHLQSLSSALPLVSRNTASSDPTTPMLVQMPCVGSPFLYLADQPPCYKQSGATRQRGSCSRR